MARIATFVFFDTEATGLPTEEHNRTRITELSMVAVSREHLLDQGEVLNRQAQSSESATAVPRVVNKLTLCLYPRKMISAESSRITGLTNELLEHQVHFNEKVFTILDNFLTALKGPVCLVSHNGHRFDFPLLKNHLDKLNVHFSADILCADSLYALYDICEGDEERKRQEAPPQTEENDVYSLLTSMQAQNESTPRKRKVVQAHCPRKIRKIYFEDNKKPKESYSVSDIHKRIVGGTPLIAHRAEDDCMLLLEIAVKMGEKFLQQIDESYSSFQNIKPMRPGVCIGD